MRLTVSFFGSFYYAYNDLIGNCSPSSCTLLANDEAALKGNEGFLLGESLKKNWLDG